MELEQACVRCVPEVREAAAVACPPPGGGPDALSLFLVAQEGAAADEAQLLQRCRAAVRRELNPLFRVQQARGPPPPRPRLPLLQGLTQAAAQVVLVGELPRTASNKVMRRSLRARLQQRQAAASGRSRL